MTVPVRPEFPGNSRRERFNKPAPEQKPPAEDMAKKVVVNPVKKKRRSLITRFTETFFGVEPKELLQNLMWDVMIPAAKTLLSDMADTALWGEPRGRRDSRGPSNGRSIVPYNSMSRKRESNDEPRFRPNRNRYQLDEYIIGSRQEAEDALNSLAEQIDEYGEVSVAAFFTAIDEPSKFVDSSWGWDDLTESYIERDRSGGFVIHMPEPHQLRR
jgi:hypothetical protein